MLEEIQFDPEQLSLPEATHHELELEDREATVDLGRRVAENLDAGDFVGLVGQLGSGKTTLVGGLVEALGATNPATSPTYTLANVYETSPPVYHVDLYRLETVDDLESVGYWDYTNSEQGVLVVEWLDRIPEAWPGEGIVIYLKHQPDGRSADIWMSDALRDRIESLSDDTEQPP
jgi:tRNA threonylcarbamoyladenosine biosynthesis protein TsaE